MLPDPSIRLRDAVTEGNLLIVKRLLRRFPELLTNTDPRNGWTSLHYASYHGRYLVCVYLIQLGHDKRELMRTFKGNTCVHLSLMNGHEQTTHLLLQYFPRFIDEAGDHGRTPVHIACMHDHFQCLSLLMGVGAKLFIPDDDGDTPLHVCLEYGSVSCMKMLILDGGITDNSTKNNYNWRPSDVAETYEMAKLYSKMLKEAQMPGLPRKASYNSFRTPVLSSKPVFDDGPSPVLTMNSPYSLYSQNAQIPTLPRISTSRGPSVALSSKSPIGNSSLQSRYASKNSSLTNSSTSLHKKDTLNSVIEKQPTKSSSELSPQKKVKHVISKSNSGGTYQNNTTNANAEFINKYLTSAATDGIENPVVPAPQSEEKDDNTNPTSKEHPVARRRVSLLNIPVAKLRHSHTSVNSDNS